MSKLYCCDFCKKKKQEFELYVRKTRKVNFNVKICMTCFSNQEIRKEYDSLYHRYYHKINYEAIKNKRKSYFKKYYIDNQDTFKENNKKHKLEKPHLNAAREAKRRASKIDRTPKWLSESDLSKIKSIYKLARSLSKKTGELYVVDHIVPLQGDIVSGLHVPWNLQVITQTENSKKYNKLIEDMICS